MRPSPARIGWLLGSGLAYAVLAYAVPRANLGGLLGLYGLLFAGYGWQLWAKGVRIGSLPDGQSLADDQERPIQPDGWLFGGAIAFRLLLLLAPPQLSDDYARFIWDGRLLAHGHNPYLYRPADLTGTALAASANLTADLFRRLNSPDYFTVYPPVGQALFALAARLSPHSLTGAVVWLRLPIIGADLGSLWLLTTLLRRAGRSPNLALIYGLNPLVILELTGNVHAEAILIFFVLLAIRWWQRGWWAGSAGALALAIGTKLLPLLLLPLVIRHLGWPRGLRFAGLTGGFTALLFLPFLSPELVVNLWASLGLYAHTFSFNASVFQVVNRIGTSLLGRSISANAGIALSLLTVVGTGWVAWRWGRMAPLYALLLTLTGYYLLATTVHPWYISSLVVVSVFSRFRYPLLWSGLVWLSYAAYQTRPYAEIGWLTGLEYAGVLGMAGWELWGTYRKNN
jgi:alpha-1,6-mannosyltransferase